MNYTSISLNDSVTYQNGNFWVGDPVPDNNVYGYWYNYYWPTYYPTVVYEQSKVDKAFKIIKVLQEKSIIDIKKVKDFVDLVTSISDLL